MRTDKIKWTELITGILLILLGIYSLIRPVGMLTGVTVIYGLFAVITGIADITLKQYFLGSQKSADYPLIFFRRFIWLSRKAYAATTGTSQPSAFNFLRYALILRSLLN